MEPTLMSRRNSTTLTVVMSVGWVTWNSLWILFPAPRVVMVPTLLSLSRIRARLMLP